MDAAAIQAKVNRGAGIATRFLGQPFDWRRPYRALNPLGPEARMGTLTAYMDPDYGFKGQKPNLYGKPLWGGLFDRTATRVGDYLYGTAGTFFIAGQQPLLPTVVVECNAVVTVSRPAAAELTSAPLADEDTYEGTTAATDGPLMAGWPASVLKGGRQEAGRADLPADPSMGGYQVLLPAWPGVTLQVSDRIKDDQGRAMVINLAELTDLGWRLACTYSGLT